MKTMQQKRLEADARNARSKLAAIKRVIDSLYPLGPKPWQLDEYSRCFDAFYHANNRLTIAGLEPVSLKGWIGVEDIPLV